jgi:hypothetical protein
LSVVALSPCAIAGSTEWCVIPPARAGGLLWEWLLRAFWRDMRSCARVWGPVCH